MMEHNIYIPHLSVDCVLFGFDENQLKVLVIERELVEGESSDLRSGLLKLPGRLVFEQEYLQGAADSLVKELGIVESVHMQQFKVFDNPSRIQSPNDLHWLQTQTQLTINRVVTIAFYGLIEISDDLTTGLEKHNAKWLPIEDAKGLAFDHDEIVQSAYVHLKNNLTNSPLEFKLMPELFTLNSLQRLYEVILNQKFDNRNFRKKIQKMPYLIETNEKEQNVTHRPAKLFRFDAVKYEENKREMSLEFL